MLNWSWQSRCWQWDILRGQDLIETYSLHPLWNGESVVLPLHVFTNIDHLMCLSTSLSECAQVRVIQPKWNHFIDLHLLLHLLPDTNLLSSFTECSQADTPSDWWSLGFLQTENATVKGRNRLSHRLRERSLRSWSSDSAISVDPHSLYRWNHDHHCDVLIVAALN